MLSLRYGFLVLVAYHTCLTSAFSTRFMIEGVGEEKKTPEVEATKTPKMEENKVVEELSPQEIKVEVIPIATDTFTQTEDLTNLTPLKLVTAIAAEHLQTVVRNLPIAGNTAQDAFNMLQSIVQEINKTAQIMKLTAEYVHISGHYILSMLNQTTHSDCGQSSADQVMRSVRKNFLATIISHISKAMKELNEKTKQREITGSDILVSSSYHIVTAFQEMTNYAVAVLAENKKCNSLDVTPPSEDSNRIAPEKKTINSIFSVDVVPEQGKKHKSIKKDQAQLKFENNAKRKPEDFQDNLTLENLKGDQGLTVENLKGDQDLTVEIFSPESFLQKHKTDFKTDLKHKKKLRLETKYSPKKTISLFEMTKKDGLSNQKTHEEFVTSTKEEIETKTTDPELASSAVDSLSNVPWVSTEAEIKNLDKTMIIQDEENSAPKFVNVLELFAPGYQSTQKPKQDQCDDQVLPVCGIDKVTQRFIIFLNDCKREAHNREYNTNYVWSTMETCVGLFLRSPAVKSQLATNHPR